MNEQCIKCKGIIKPGKVYSKVNMNSAWYIVIKVIDFQVYYKKINVANIKYENEVDFNINIIGINLFEKLFKYETTIYCENRDKYEKDNTL